MKLRIDSANEKMAKQVRQMMHYSRAAVTAEIAEIRVWVNEFTDALDRRLVGCRVQLRLSDGSLVVVDEVQSTLHLAVARALERSVRSVRRRRRLRNQAA